VFVDFDFQSLGITPPNSPSWWGQYHHETSEINKDINQWNILDTNGNTLSPEDKYHLFLLVLADHLASSVSRPTLELKERQTLQEGILKLWNKNYYTNQENSGRHWAAFRTVNDLKVLFSEIQNCQSREELLEKYKVHLLLTPEDKSIPRNVTSLYTHLELVGKIYRVFDKNTQLIKEQDGTILVEYSGRRVKKIKEAEGGKRITGTSDVDKGKWQARLVKCWIKFPHSFVRLRDINLLRKREELVNRIVGYYQDEVLFAISDFLILILPLNQDLEEIFKPLLNLGFYIEIEETLADLGILNSILHRKTLKARELNDKPTLNILNNRGTKVYKKYLLPELPVEIQPPICDICQWRKGIERIKDNIKEWVCKKCQKIRDMGEPFWEYGTIWEEEGAKVCWFKFSLDQNKLETWLLGALELYINEIIKKLENKQQHIQCKINERLSDQQNKKEELEELRIKVKSLYNKEKKRKVGEKIKKISKEIKGIESEIKCLKNEEEKLRKYKEELEKVKKEARILALQIDFNKDYKEMLKEFWNEFSKYEDVKKPIVEYDELGVFKYSPELTKKVIEKFLNLFEQHFPDCATDEESPISLSLSIASIKYPIREHWRFFEENNRNFLNIRYYRVFNKKYTKDELKIIIEKAINVKTSSSFLHKLVQIEESLRSDTHIAVEILNNRRKYREIYELFSKGIKPSKFLSLYRLLKGEE